jgi:hypothetical protein
MEEILVDVMLVEVLVGWFRGIPPLNKGGQS